tara:strand:+ start:699 stop:956 length:258 start_codon:yes stop_codon:yes gene_type:complete
MKIFKLFKEVERIKDVLTLIFTQQLDLKRQLCEMQEQLDSMQLDSIEPPYEEFEDELGDIQIPTEVYNAMCEYLEQEEMDLVGLT